MNDFEKSYQDAIRSDFLKSKWSDKIRLIEDSWNKYAPSTEECNLEPEDKARWERDYLLFQGRTVDANEECRANNQKLREWVDGNKEIHKMHLGSYENWAYKQSGLEKYHQWLKYPNDLRERLAKGERGLMLGDIWKYLF
jgi:hypothetical protein